MNAGLLDIARREFIRLRWSQLALYSVSVLVALAAAHFLPRAYVAEAVLSFRAGDTAPMAAVQDQLRALTAEQPDGELRMLAQGQELRISWESASLPVTQALGDILDTLSADSSQSLLQTLAAQREPLERKLQAARAALAKTQKELQSALAARPEGANISAAAARLGRLQAEADTLGLSLRDGTERAAQLAARVRELDEKLDLERPDAAGIELLEQKLEQAQARLNEALVAASRAPDQEGAPAPDSERAVASARSTVDTLLESLKDARNRLADGRARLAGLAAQRGSALEELASLRSRNDAAVRRQGQLKGMIDEARTELERIERDDVQLRQLRETEDTAKKLLRESEATLARHDEQEQRQRARPELPYTLELPLAAPRIATGLAMWQYVALAQAGGLAAALVYLLAVVLSAPSAKSLTRLANELQVTALVELPVWRDAIADRHEGRRRAVAVILFLLSSAASVAFWQLQ